MIQMGDEVRRSQGGNNNAYCHDNETTWFDWSLVERHADLHRFVSLLVDRRLLRDMRHERGRVSLIEFLKKAEHAWHGVKLNQPDWSDGSHAIALTAELRDENLRFHLILNAFWQALDFELPPIDAAREGSWHRWIDTSLESPNDIVPWESAPSVSGSTYRASPRSVVLLLSTPITLP
jgi:glycogen operon protein